MLFESSAAFRGVSPNAPWRVELLECVDSTNTALKRLAAQGEAEGKVLIADRQTAGRGRMTRTFFSPPDSGLYMSMLLRPTLSAADALLLTSSAAVSVAEAIEGVVGIAVGIKWVNDLYVRQRKVCGILTETALTPEGGLDYAVIGIGVNLRAPADGFPAELEEIAGALLPLDAPADPGLRERLAAAILDRCAARFADLPDVSYLAEYRRRLILVGRSVTLSDTGERVTVEGVDDACRLLVRDEKGISRAVSMGECSVRL